MPLRLGQEVQALPRGVAAMGVPRIVVVGSCNMDIAAFVRRAPEQGETVSGTRSKTSPGGKGANQAIAAARLGASVSFVGAVGADAYGESLRAAFTSAGVEISHLRTVERGDGQRAHRRRGERREPDRRRARRERRADEPDCRGPAA